MGKTLTSTHSVLHIINTHLLKIFRFMINKINIKMMIIKSKNQQKYITEKNNITNCL